MEQRPCWLRRRLVLGLALDLSVGAKHGLYAGMEIRRLEIPGPVVVVPRKFQDDRGFLSETYVHEWFCTNVAQINFVQENHSYSVDAGTIRGIHFQTPPYAQAKLVRVVRGAVWDVAVDLRKGSPSYGRHVAVELSAANWQQLWIPVGFGHAFCTLEPNSEVVYKISSRYQPDSERGVIWDDPDLAIDWPVESRAAVLSARDQRLPRLGDLPDVFHLEQPTG